MDTNSENGEHDGRSASGQANTSVDHDGTQDRNTLTDQIANTDDQPHRASSPIIGFLFKLFLILLVVSFSLPTPEMNKIFDFIHIPVVGIYRVVIMLGLVLIFSALTILFGVLSTRSSKEKTLLTISLVGGGILTICLIFNFATRVIPGLLILDFLGTHLWVGAIVAIICLFTSVIGLTLSLFSHDTRSSILRKLLYVVLIAISVGAFLNFTIPVINYLNEQNESWKSYQPVNIPKTADEWVAMNASDYSIVTENINACNIAEVTAPTKNIDNTSARYLDVKLYYSRTVSNGNSSKKVERHYLILPYKDNKRLETDMATAKIKCTKVEESVQVTTKPPAATTATPSTTPANTSVQTIAGNCSTLPSFQDPKVLQYSSTYIFKSHDLAQKHIITAWQDNGVTMSPISYKETLVAVDKNCKTIDISTLKSGDTVKLYLRTGYSNFYNDALVLIQKTN